MVLPARCVLRSLPGAQMLWCVSSTPGVVSFSVGVNVPAITHIEVARGRRVVVQVKRGVFWSVLLSSANESDGQLMTTRFIYCPAFFA